MSADETTAAGEDAGPDAPTDPVADPVVDAVADPVKDKFREALERKRGHQADREAASDRLGSAKIGSEHASAKTKRTFRRKSG